jgi:GT2 family glycosyltransferase
MEDNSLVSVVILNWNCRQFLLSCIDSVLEQTYQPIELVFMDNDSEDGSVAWVKENYPHLRTIENHENLGFAKAHNLGIRQTQGHHYMPLNPDVILTPTYIAEMVAALEEDDVLGSASGKVYFTDPEGKPSRRIYTTGHLLTRNRKPSNRGYKQVDEGQFSQKDYIFGVNGACPLLKRAMLDDVAIHEEYFDEAFFLYGDDYDLGWRAQLMGWRSIYVPTAIAYHYGKGSGGLNSPQIQFQYARNRYIEIYKNDLLTHFLLDLPYIIAYEVLWQGYTLLTDPRRTIAHARAIIGFLRLLPETHRKRRKIHARRKVTATYMRSLFTRMVLR